LLVDDDQRYTRNVKRAFKHLAAFEDSLNELMKDWRSQFEQRKDNTP
jgi:ActR/RegA family two-component response regulator